MNSGELIRKIRTNKKMNQTYLTNNHFSQAALSYFEKHNNQISYQAFREILTKLNMTLEEFSFIQNNYEYEEKESILMKFYNIHYNNMDKLQEIIKLCHRYLEVNKDVDIEQLLIICEGLKILKNTGDIEQAKHMVLPIWNEIIKRKQWYLRDIYFMNTILFVVSKESVIDFSKKIIERLDNYKDFSNIKHMKSTIILNVSMILILNKDYSLAEKMLMEQFSTEKLRLSLATFILYLNRLAICQYHTKTEDYQEKLEVISTILKAVNEEILLSEIQIEFEKNTKE